MAAQVSRRVVDFTFTRLNISSLILITKTSAAAVTSFIPTLVATIGLSRVQTLLLVAPPYICAAAIMLAVSRMSDRLGERAYHIICPMGVAIMGFVFAAFTVKVSVRYMSLFLMLGGVYGSYNVALAWISSTVRSSIRAFLTKTDTQPAPSPSGEAVSSNCHHQHDGQHGPDLLAVLLPAPKWAPVSVRNGVECFLLCCLH